MEKYSLYVQQYMNTFIVLLADSGLQHKHHILNELVCRGWENFLALALDLVQLA